MISISYLFRAKKARIGLEQAISEALEALELVSTLQIERNLLLCLFCIFVFINDLSEFKRMLVISGLIVKTVSCL